MHIVDGFKLKSDVGLLLTDFFKSAHNTTQRIDVLGGLLDLKFDLLDLISEILEESLCLLVEITAERVFPAVDPAFEPLFNEVSFEGQCADLV